MSDYLVPVITNAGLAAVANAQGSGLQATIASLGVGTGVVTNGVGAGYTPSQAATTLKSEAVRVPILSGSRLDPAGFRILARVPSSSAPATYIIQEVGFYLDTGVLFAVWSSPGFPLAAKTGLADVDLALDLLLEQLPVASLAISVLEPDVPDTTGVLAELLATQANLFSQTLLIQKRLVAKKI